MRMMPLVPAGLRIPGLRYCWSCESANRRSAGDNHDRQQQGGVSGPYQAQPLVVKDAWADQLCLIPVFLGSEFIRFGHFRSMVGSISRPGGRRSKVHPFHTRSAGAKDQTDK